MNKIFFIFCFSLFTVYMYSQDARELLYNIEILQPNHAPKPKVEGFAKERIEEKFNRGIIAVEDDNKNVYISWRLLKSDPIDVAFDIYRGNDNSSVKLNRSPISTTTDFVDKNARNNSSDKYWVIPVGKNNNGSPSKRVSVNTKKSTNEPAYISIPLQEDVVPGRRRLAVADLNGDGEFDFVLIQPNVGKDPGFRTD